MYLAGALAHQTDEPNLSKSKNLNLLLKFENFPWGTDLGR